jgi:ABC-2 type transport system ATP-binding protein
VSGVAISCEGVWKSYRIYHQRSHSLKEKVLSRRNMYEDFWALRGVDLEVPEGSTFGIVGANGSGKSTLLKTMARILSPNRGRVDVHGLISPLLELGTGFHPELTGKENVYLSGSLLGQARRDVDRRYDAIVEFAGIESFMDIPVKNYSSGMYARLAFATAISVDPEILIIDEVLSVGDEAFQIRCYERIAEFRAQGRTIVLVSHGLEAIRALCSDAAWVEDGVIRCAGPTHDVVAAYLGGVDRAGTARRALPSTDAVASKSVEIVDIAFLDGSDDEASKFRTGDPMTVRLRYRAQEAVDAVFAIAVFRAGDLAYAFGQNSALAHLRCVAGEGGVDFTAPSLPLLPGSYVVSVAVHDTTGTDVYDAQERAAAFSVLANPVLPPAAGIVHVPGEWTAIRWPVPAGMAVPEPPARH